MKREHKEVIEAALAWWLAHRPAGWSVEQHLANPEVNVSTISAKRLCRAVARSVKTRALARLIAEVRDEAWEAVRGGVPGGQMAERGLGSDGKEPAQERQAWVNEAQADARQKVSELPAWLRDDVVFGGEGDSYSCLLCGETTGYPHVCKLFRRALSCSVCGETLAPLSCECDRSDCDGGL